MNRQTEATIYAKTLIGNTFKLDVESNTTVLELKDMLIIKENHVLVEHMRGYDKPKLVLTFRGAPLVNEEATVKELGIEENDTLNL